MSKPLYSDAEIVRQIIFDTRAPDPGDWYLRSWNQGPVLFYSVPTTAPDPSSNDSGNQAEDEGFVFGAQELSWQPFALRAFEAWDELIALSLTPTTAAFTDITLAFSTNTKDSGTYMAANVDSVGDDQEFNQAQVWVNPTWDEYDTLVPRYGDRGYETFLHEIGHALGLFHPGPYNAGDPDLTYANRAVFAQDTIRYTIMSYFGENDDGSGTDWKLWKPLTPMVYDILAIQEKYGADPNTRTGNDVYGFNSNIVDTLNGGIDPIYSFTAGERPVMSIYDAGGIDTLDLSGFGTRQVVDLKPGAYSSISDLKFNFGIAFGTVIENVRGGSGDDLFYGNDADNVFEGGAGADDMSGAGGFDTATYVNAPGAVRVDLLNPTANRGEALGDKHFDIEGLTGGAFNDTLSGDGWDNRLTGGNGGDLLDGRAGQDVLRGGGGNDTLTGGAGLDTLYGDEGNADTASYAASPTAVIARLAGLLDQTRSSGGDAQGDLLLDIENIIGSARNDILVGRGTDNLLRGGLGNDELLGLDGADSLNGEGGDDTLKGGFGSDRLDGSIGTDRADYRDAPGAVSAWLVNTEAAVNNTGHAAGDTYFSVENLFGSAFADTLVGNAVGNLLDGGLGYDDLRGGRGNDSYVLDYTHVTSGEVYFGGFWDRVTEDALGGTDTVYVTRQANRFGQLTIDRYDLGANVENGVVAGSLGFMLVGNVLNNAVTGGAGNDYFVTGDGADTLDGGLGWDTHYGEFGNDTYVLGDIFDWYSGSIYVGAFRDDVLEPLNGGIDTVYVTAAWSTGLNRLVSNYTLVANVENGIVTGDNAFTLVGNVLANALRGGGGDDRMVAGDAADTLEGGAGADTMFGEFGDDTYVLKDVTRLGDIFGNDVWDTILEAGPGGIDTVLVERALRPTSFESWRSDYTLADFIENGRITGTQEFTLNGNVLANRLTGNEAFNFILGHDGADTISGMGGGDALNGGAAADRLIGGAGADTLDGGTGRDVLTGGTEADIFVISSIPPAADVDTVSDFLPGEDRILLSLAALDPGGTSGLVAGSLADQAGRFAANLTGAATTRGLAQVVYETDTGRIWWDADGAGGGARVLLVSLTDTPVVTAGDVWVG
jgi:serralysin